MGQQIFGNDHQQSYGTQQKANPGPSVSVYSPPPPQQAPKIHQQNVQFKVATLYYSQDPLRNTRRYVTDGLRKSKVNNGGNSNYQSGSNRQEINKQNSLSEMKNSSFKKSQKSKLNSSHQIKNQQFDEASYNLQQAKILGSLKEYMYEKGIRRTAIKNPTLHSDILSKKRQLGQFQNNGGNTNVPTGAYDNKYYALPSKIIYRGQWYKEQQNVQSSTISRENNKIIHGKGQYYLPDNTYIEAFSQFNKIHGYGRLINMNGDHYQGQIEHNKANGIGRYWEGDIFYNGGFKDNLPHGNGQQYTDLYTFIGQFENGFRKKGKLTWKTKKDDPHQYVYEGQFQNNLIKPSGKLKMNGKMVYIQNFSIK